MVVFRDSVLQLGGLHQYYHSKYISDDLRDTVDKSIERLNQCTKPILLIINEHIKALELELKLKIEFIKEKKTNIETIEDSNHSTGDTKKISRVHVSEPIEVQDMTVPPSNQHEPFSQLEPI